MVMNTWNKEGNVEYFYSQSRVQRRVARVTRELDINRHLAHLKWVGGKAVKEQKRSSGNYTTEISWGQLRQHSIDLHRVRKVVNARERRGRFGAVRTASRGDLDDAGGVQGGHRVRSKKVRNPGVYVNGTMIELRERGLGDDCSQRWR